MSNEILGRHVLGRFEEIPFDILDSVDYLQELIKLAVKEAKMTLCKVGYEKFIPQGVTIFAILAESHIAIHTWPEKGMAAVECFTCGELGDPKKAVEVIRDLLGSRKWTISELDR